MMSSANLSHTQPPTDTYKDILYLSGILSCPGSHVAYFMSLPHQGPEFPGTWKPSPDPPSEATFLSPLL